VGKVGVMAKVGWVSMIGENTAKPYCRVPPHEDIVPQSAEEGGVPTSSICGVCPHPCIPPTWQHHITSGVGFNDREDSAEAYCRVLSHEYRIIVW